jgi:drug/metabolite transporter (DMT)-like permease
MLAFAANTIFCRLALGYTDIDAASFTTVRLISGALTLWLIATMSHRQGRVAGSWFSAMALFAYAACFSFAYINLSTATGALLLFGAVQFTMILAGFMAGERLNGQQTIGLLLALGGLVYLLLPGITAPPLGGAVLMLLAGIAWGVYSLRGRGVVAPLASTAGNFMRTLPMTFVLSLIMLGQFNMDAAGTVYAVLSGALASGVGYAVWYSVLPSLKAANAATVQLSVPVIAAVGGALFAGEMISLRIVFASLAILGGIALVIRQRSAVKAASR